MASSNGGGGVGGGGTVTTVTSPTPTSSSSSASTIVTNFESFHQNVCTNLRNRGEVHSVSKVFAQCGTDDDRMRYVLEQNFTNCLKWKDHNYVRKDKAESHKLRDLGNQVYQKNKLSEALDFYNQSILLAPHPPPPNMFMMPGFHEQQQQEEGFPHEELALGFANRSAVLFQMKEYELCIRDITRAFDNSYPNNIMYKLFERKGRCLKALKQYPRALEAMKSAEMWMKYSTLSEAKSSSFKKEINKQVEFLDEKVAAMSISEFSENAAEHRKNMTIPLKSIPTPELTKDASREVPCARADVKLMYNDKKGRFFVATEDIPAGEIVITETPYSSILLPEYYNSHCQTCYHRMIAPIPCWCCAKVRFCSDECRMEAWERFHKVECQQLELILDSSLGKMGMLSMRILTSSGKIYLDYIVHKVAEENEARKIRFAGSNPGEVARQTGFNEENVYDSADYRTIYTLVGNTKQRSVGDLFKRALMAAYLLKILEMTPFFYNGGSDPRNVKLADKVAMGSVLLKHLQNLPCNAHEVAEMELCSAGGSSSSMGGNSGSGSSRESIVHNEIGAAVFGTLSLLNHSCDPNVVRHYYSANAAVRTIRPIKKGEELLDNYGYHYAVTNKGDRQKSLSSQYYFNCQCEACTDNWQTYQKLPSNLEPLPSKDEKSVMAELQKMTKNYRKAFDSIVQGSFTNESATILFDYLNFLDQNFKRPVKEYNDCQEALKQCLSGLANFHSQKSSKKEGKDKDN